MKKIIYSGVCLLAGFWSHHVHAQCTVSLISSGNCYPIQLTAQTSSPADSIHWYHESQLIHASSGNTFASEGIVVAGNNGQGSASNQLNHPSATWVDAAQHIYIADSPNHRIQKWIPGATEGITVAGGNGNGTTLDKTGFPVGIALDEIGNIYVCEGLNQRVTKWTPGATEGVLVAGGNGNGDALNQLSFPGGIYYRDNALYIMDAGNSRVVKWMIGDTAGTIVAGGNGFGSALNQIGNPMLNGGIYVDESHTLYIAEYSNNRATKWVSGATEGILVAGGNGSGSEANQFNNPTGIFVSPEGIFITEYMNHRVQFWANGATEGITVCGGIGYGTSLMHVGQPYAVSQVNGDLFVTEYGNHRVMKFNHSVADSTLQIEQPGIYTVISFNNGCSDTATITISTPTHIAVTCSDTIFCAGNSSVISAAPNDTFSYQWFRNGTPYGGDSSELIVTESGSYMLITTWDAMCPDTSASITIQVNPLPAPIIDTDFPQMTVPGIYSFYQWFLNDSVISGATNPTLLASVTGSYKVYVSDSNGCSGYSDTVFFEETSGLFELEGFNAVVYPNPVSENLFITIVPGIQEVTYRLLQQDGIILDEGVLINDTQGTASIPVDTLHSGLYFLQLMVSGKVMELRFVRL